MLLMNLMIQLVSGMIGGNAASGAFSHTASGTAGNSLLGALGGLCCAQLLSPGRLVSGSLDLDSMAVQIVVCVLGGGALVLLTGVFRSGRRPGSQER